MTWSGRKVAAARAYWRPRLPLPCWRGCGRVLTADGPWTVGHIVDRALGGSETDPSNQLPECGKCNSSAGGKLGASITNSKRQSKTQTSTKHTPTLTRMTERDRGIRGW